MKNLAPISHDEFLSKLVELYCYVHPVSTYDYSPALINLIARRCPEVDFTGAKATKIDSAVVVTWPTNDRVRMTIATSNGEIFINVTLTYGQWLGSLAEGGDK